MNTKKITKTEIKNAYYSKADLAMGKDISGCWILREDKQAQLIRKVREMKIDGSNLKAITQKILAES
jgi:hypothetical protein